MAWQPITTAPKNGTYCLLFGSSSDVVVDCVRVGRWSLSARYGPRWMAFEYRSDTEYLTPTHWMPLPAPPETEGRA